MLPIRLSQIAGSYYFERDYENAVLTAQEVVRISPTSPLPYRWLAASFGQMGRNAEAAAALQTLAEIGSGLVDDQIRQRPLHWRPVDYEHLLEGLRKAGWQESC
jgi:adenylate cyclase